jgi:hypothetical protein
MKAKLVLRTIAPERRLSPAEALAYTVIKGAVCEMRAGLGRQITTAHWRAVSASCWLLDEGRQWVETLPPEAADLVTRQARQVVRAAVDAGFSGIGIQCDRKNWLRLVR